MTTRDEDVVFEDGHWYEQDICTSCNGSGEGYCDGTKCNTCSGKGFIYHEIDEP